MNYDKVFAKTTRERIVRFYVREFEKQANYILPICSAVYKRNIESTFTIIDLAEATVGVMAPRFIACAQIASEISQNYYPEAMEM